MQTEADPRYQAHLAAVLADEELLARVAADRLGQEERLRAGGWRCSQDGNDGVGCWDLIRGGGRPHLRLIHSLDREDGQLWAHVSLSRRDGILPGWEDLRDTQWLLYPQHYGVIVVAPPGQHVNLSEVAHVWTRLDGPTVPDFTHGLGTI